MKRSSYTGSVEEWGRKVDRVASRLQVSAQWGVERGRGWVRFTYGGTEYVLEQTVDKARQQGIELPTMRDCLAQAVLTFEDLARMAERGIYDLGVLAAGMKALPPPLPATFRVLGFTTAPASMEEVRQRYRALVKTAHPDHGGHADHFQALTEALHEAEALLSGQ